MLSWLSDILGDNYTEDIEKKISQEIGKNFVAKADFNAKNDALKNLEAQVRERDTQLETLRKSTGDAAALLFEIDKAHSAVFADFIVGLRTECKHRIILFSAKLVLNAIYSDVLFHNRIPFVAQ